MSGLNHQNLPLLHSETPLRRTPINRLFAVIYSLAILTLIYHHTKTLLNSTTIHFFFISLSLLVSDAVLAFLWAAAQSFRMCPLRRKEFLDNLEQVVSRADFPAMDIFICTADPYKEPPLNVVNTALSVMAYDYPSEKVSVYVSDDGGSELTLFAFMEAAVFAAHWLPFCRKHNLLERSPEEFFGSNTRWGSEEENIKMMYENMKLRVKYVVEKGKVCDEYISTIHHQNIFSKWNNEFTRHDHPAVIQVLLNNSTMKDIEGQVMPNLIYVAREKHKNSPHHFKAGALNALLRVSAVMTNAPIILTLDCDMYSNDPRTPLRALCYTQKYQTFSNLGYIQFPQRFHGLNKSDIYTSELKYLFVINAKGMDGLSGPNYVGSGCFFLRRVFFGPPSFFISPEISELSPDHLQKESVLSESVLELAHKVAGSNYENNTKWGSKIGFRYGSLVEDFFTGYRLQCEGWRAIFCNPERAAFYGDVPINLVDALSQTQRWAIGLLEVNFSKYNPLTFKTSAMNPLMRLAYAHYSCWPLWSIPVFTYAFLPQLALIYKVSILPKVSEQEFFLYIFLLVAAYAQDLLDFTLDGGRISRWWSSQRMWMIRSLSSFAFGLTEYTLKSLGISTFGFNVTSKVIDDEQSKRYDQGSFEFGAPSPMFVPITMAAIISLISFLSGIMQIFNGGDFDGLALQMLIAGFVIVNCCPIYEAIVLRSDKGKMPLETSIVSLALVCVICILAGFVLRI